MAFFTGEREAGTGNMSQSGLMGALSDPRLQSGLLGMGQGLLQAAGPTPHPVGMGGAMGSGSAGLLSGWLGAEQMMRDREFMDEIMKMMRQGQGPTPGTPMPGGPSMGGAGMGGPQRLPGMMAGMGGGY